MAEDLKGACDSVSITTNGRLQNLVGSNGRATADHATHSFANYQRQGFETVLVVRCGAYVEIDVADMLSFHQQQGNELTRAFTDIDNEPLDVWLADPSSLPDNAPLLSALSSAPAAMFRSQKYANRLQSPRDFRRLILDCFQGRCNLRPHGTEVKPGVWVCEGAQIARSARIVAPAFVGRNVQISDECLITRGSNIESNSVVDYGTVVEDSSVLSNTYVGIGLDLSHSIVDGRNLLNLQHNVSLEITDPVVMRENDTSVRGYETSAGIESDRVALSSAE
jgi:NDP-sugar pyrophosphorylase family protein